MNKKELVEKIESLPSLTSITSIRPYVDKKIVLGLISQLDEPEKVVIPQFVADWYEDVVDEFYIVLERLVLNYRNNTNMPIYKWFLETEDALKILINMHQFGYTVEKEKRYLVKVKGVNEYGCYLNKGLLSKEYFLESKAEIGGCRTKHTRKQLEDDDFGWVFDCEGIEVEEVTE